MTWAFRLMQSRKGVDPVDLFLVAMMANRTCAGRASTQPFCYRSTKKRRAWMTVLFVFSLAPSVWGWNDVLNFSFTHERWWSASQNFEVSRWS